MTKTTLKALWLGGGGLLATWLAVTPNQGVPTSSPTSQRSAPLNGPSADDLRVQADRLRERTSTVTLRASTRNPFRFNDSKLAAASRVASVQPTAIEPAPAAVASPPSLTLNGVTGKQTSEGVQRTAVISGDGQMYFVGEGDSVAGKYTVIKIDPEAVVLRDASGAEIRLGLP